MREYVCTRVRACVCVCVQVDGQMSQSSPDSFILQVLGAPPRSQTLYQAMPRTAVSALFL